MQKINPMGVGSSLRPSTFAWSCAGGKQNSVAVTSTMLGVFRNGQQTREEFLSLVRDNRG
jgi:GTP cyclohydrolase I